jgi:heat shock protein HtpX
MTTPETLDHFAQRRNRSLNTLHTWLLAAGSLALLAITAWTFGGAVGIAYAIVFGSISMWLVRRVSPQMVLSMYKARPVSAAEFPAGIHIVGELSRRAGLAAPPKLYVIPSKMMNAFAVGRRDDSVIAITDALARTLTPRELAGVLAHEISHIANEDVRVMALADMVSRFTSLMSTVGILSLILNLGSYMGGVQGSVPWLAVAVLLAAPTIGGLLQLALSRTREFGADLGAAMLTGDPDGLAAALVRLERVQGRLWETIVLPGGRIPDPSVLRTHPLTAERVARLNHLKTVAKSPVDDPLLGAAGGPRLPRRPASVPTIRRAPHYGLFGVQPLVAVSALSGGDADIPASRHPLNPPQGNPRIHVRHGAVWW